jgi:glycosyltransferase involved in cell wall biosynthesis
MAPEPSSLPSRRVTLVADELRGFQGGGLGTATTFLAVAAARMGHEVEVLYLGAATTEAMEPEWARLYSETGVRIRVLPRSDERIDPPYFARLLDVNRALQADPPHVVITQDLAAPAYVSLRQRQLGLAFEDTLFVVYCHGTRRWIADVSRKVRVLPGALAVSLLEQRSIELADIAVSPSAYMIDWMRGQGWRMPSSTAVIPLLTRSGATGGPVPRIEFANGRVERIAFFGRLEERKGVRPFVAGINALDPALLDGVELVFLGKPWSITPGEIESSLSHQARRALRTVSFESKLDQSEALARLSQPGTVAVMPSLEDNSPATVYECLERGIPFVASDAGGTAELIADEDRGRVLFKPTPAGVESALRRVLVGTKGFEPAHPAFDANYSYQRWAEVIAMQPPAHTAAGERPLVTVVVIRGASEHAPSRCLSALERQRYEHVEVAVADAGRDGLEIGGPWVVFLDADDLPDPKLVEALVRAQVASGADIVTCGVRLLDGDDTPLQRFYLGEPGALGLLSNSYGTVALLRRSLLEHPSTGWPAANDLDWPLLARLSLTGARIVSIPQTLVERRARPEDPTARAASSLQVAELFEQQLPQELSSLPRLTAGLAASRTRRPRRNALRHALNGISRSLRSR